MKLRIGLLLLFAMTLTQVNAQKKEKPIYQIVDEMPRFVNSDCEKKLFKKKKKKCSDEAMLQFIYQNISYPKQAQKEGIEGTCVVIFIVEKDGSITGAKVIRDIGGGCGEECKALVEKMPNFIPGRQRNTPVRVQFTLPIKFSLE